VEAPDSASDVVAAVPRIAVTMGDMNGIGPEVIIRTLADSRIRRLLSPVVFGSSHVLRHHARVLGITDVHVSGQDSEGSIRVFEVEPTERPKIRLGKISATAGRLAMLALDKAVDQCVAGKFDAVVTAPISKEAVVSAGFDTTGHTEYLARRLESSEYMMMMVSHQLRVGLVTSHIALRDVPGRIDRDDILRQLQILTHSLRKDFGVARPRIAVLGLNPHASDGGVMGREEADTIAPAIEAACDTGLHAFGPFPSDGFFATRSYRRFDAVLAMYHDQGLIPFKVIAFVWGKGRPRRRAFGALSTWRWTL
jgi:4-hydroxythreonine-4-phosphate dehydrogenase